MLHAKVTVRLAMLAPQQLQVQTDMWAPEFHQLASGTWVVYFAARNHQGALALYGTRSGCVEATLCYVGELFHSAQEIFLSALLLVRQTPF